MKLKFYARDDLMVTMPGARPGQGQPPEYVARKFVRGDGKNVAASHPADPDGFECNSETSVGQRLVQLTRRDAALWPADVATAAACGVEFVAVEVKDGVAVAKAAPALQSAARKSAKDEG